MLAIPGSATARSCAAAMAANASNATATLRHASVPPVAIAAIASHAMAGHRSALCRQWLQQAMPASAAVGHGMYAAASGISVSGHSR